MSCEQLLLTGSALVTASGLPAVLGSRHSNVGQRLATALLVLGNACNAWGVGTFLVGHRSQPIAWPSPVPGVEFSVAIDGLSVVFLLPLLLISTLGSIYALSYWKQSEHPDNGRKATLFYGTLVGAMTLVLLARDGVTFLFAWEVMAVSAFMLVATEDHAAEVRRAGWLYIAASHAATLCLFVLFALLGLAANSFSLTALADTSVFTPGSPLTTTMFFLALVGFGIKAGIMPCHVWLPSSHANAPSHVSALLSGVLIKVGIYGLVRVCGLLPTPPLWWGGLLLTLGIISGILGVAYAIGQHDIKRLLAYHSIENIGIIVMGFGLAMMGRALGRTEWLALGLGGALLHVWNHALFKSLLFLSAGSVVHATHTREIDHLGGLLRRMPQTALHFLVGAVAICGLPPLNGFVSEWFVYLGLFRTLLEKEQGTWVAAMLGIPALALIGGLAAACFTKVFGAVFLGVPRSAHAQHVHEAGFLMTGPMIVLTAACVAIGLVPWLVSPVLDQGIAAWGSASQPTRALAQLAELNWITIVGCTTVGAIAFGGLLLWMRLRTSVVDATVTWDCGYAAPAATMQYTASSFAQMLVEFFYAALLPKTQAPHIKDLFPVGARFTSEVPDVVLDRVLLPATRGAGWLLSWFRYLQHGNIHVYLLYVFVILVWLLWWH